MADKIVQLTDKDNNNIYPIGAGADAFTTNEWDALWA